MLSYPLDIRRGITIPIVTWNNLPFLKKAIESLQNHSTYEHRILIHVNDGSDGTLEWVKETGHQYTHSPGNMGLCAPFNNLVMEGDEEWVLCSDDDMCFLPEWDSNLRRFYEDHDLGDRVWLNSVMIEPQDGGAHSINGDYGHTPEDFREEELIEDLSEYRYRKPLLVSAHGPMIIPRVLWDEVGGYSSVYEGTMGSEDDLAKKCWDAGCRNFVGVSESLVYHFGSMSTRRINRAEAARRRDETFMRLHGISLGHFLRDDLKRGTLWNRVS